MSTQHTPEPWQVKNDSAFVKSNDGKLIALCNQSSNIDLDEKIANAARIVTCVNACEYLTNAELNEGKIKIKLSNLCYQRDQARRERDEAEAMYEQLRAEYNALKNRLSNNV